MKKFLFSALCALLFSSAVIAQYSANQDKVWVFGYHAGINFTSGTPVVFADSINTNEGSASVADASGNLLFYTDGDNVFNRTGALMPSGSSIAPWSTSSTSQAALIVPVIGSSTQYYVFSLESYSGTTDYSHLIYCIVDMSLDGGYGNVIASTLGTAVTNKLSEKMTAIPGTHCDIWLITHLTDSAVFKAYDITASGISTTPVISRVGTFTGSDCYSIGDMAVSPDHSKIATAVYATGSARGCELFDFNTSSGAVSNCRVLDSLNSYYGIEFSPDNSKLYASIYGGNLNQFDVTGTTAAAIRATLYTVTSTSYTALKLGPDGKIYFATDYGTTSLDCISSPNASGSGCGMSTGVISLDIDTSMNMGLGFPNIYIAAPGGTITTEVRHIDSSFCFGAGDSLTLSADTTGTSYLWNDGVTTRSQAFGTAGVFSVSAINGCRYNIDSFVITSLSTRVAAIAGASTTCVGSTITLTDSTSGGYWSTSSTSIATVNYATGAVRGLAAGTSIITYYVVHSGCTTVVTHTVTVLGAPTVGPLSGPTSVTVGGTITLTDTTSGGTFTSSSTAIATVSSTGTVTGVSPGVVTISYSLTNSCGTTVVTHVDTVRAASTCNIITTIAGNGSVIDSGDGRAATAAGIWEPGGIAMDNAGNIYVTDFGNRIRKISTSGVISTIAGTGASGFSGDGGPATAAVLNGPYGIAVDASGNVFFADANNLRIRKINTSGIISTVAGNGTSGYSGDGGPATAAEFASLEGVVFDASGNLFLTDIANDKIRKINTSGIITTVAGNGTPGFSGDGGPATAAELRGPTAIAFDASGNLYISDCANYRVRMVSTSGIITTVAGNGTSGHSGDGGSATSAELAFPEGLNIDPMNNLYICDQASNNIRKVTPAGIITTFAGNSTSGFSGDGGPATAAELAGPWGIIFDGTGNAYIAAAYNCRVRKVTIGNPTVSPITGPTTVCIGANITLTDATSGGSWSSGSTAIATVNSTGIVTGVSAGTAIISYSVTNSCGTTVVTQSITVNGPPATPSGITGPSTVCVGSSITLADGTSGGTWTSSNPSIASINSVGGVTGIAAGSVTITYTVTNSCGSAYATASISVVGSPSAGTISGASSVCTGANITLTDGVSGGTWTSSNAVIASVTPGGGIVTGISAGSANISYTVTTSCGTAFAIKTISVTTTPSTPHGITGASSLCTGASITLSDSTSGGTWSTSNAGIASVNTSGLVSGIATGAATITYTVSNSCGSAFAIKNISVNAGPTVGAISGSSSLCVGTSTTVTDGTSGGTWSSSNTSLATVNGAGVVTGLAVGSVTISYSVTGTCGTNSATFNMSMITIPSVAAISGSSALCNGTSTTLTDATSGGTWSSITTSVATISGGGTVFAVSGGTSLISYTLTNTCGSAAATKLITVTALPSAATITGTPTVCTGATTALADGTSGGTWSSSNSSVASVNTSGLVSGNTAGSATISYTVTSSCGTAVATIAVTVNPSPNAGTLTGASSVCTGATTSLTNSMGGGSWSSSATGVASVSSGGVVTGIAAGSVTISYSVTNSCGTAVSSHAMTINPTPSVAAITGPTTVCTGSTITLTDATSGGAWSSSNASIATVGLTGIVTGIASGSVSISYSWSNMCGTATAGAVVNVSGAPSAGTISGPSVVCTGSSITLTDAATGGVWSSSSTANATVTSSGIVFGVSAGSVTISYTVTTSCATVAATSTISVSTSASAGTISGLSSVCTGSSVTLTTSGTAGGAWSSSNTGEATVSGGIVHGLSAGTVTISYSVTSGCGTVVSTKSVTVITTPTVTAISGATNICIGTSATYTDATSGGGWISSNTAIATVNSAGLVTAISAGSATITYFVTNTCGTATTTKAITVNSLSAGVISGASTIAVGASTTLTNTVTGGVWNSAHTTLATISTGGMVTGVAVGSDSIKYSVTNVCGTANAYKIISITAHRDELPGSTVTQGEEAGINIYPNPNSGNFTLEMQGTQGTATIHITDISGRTIEQTTTNEKTLTFDLSQYAAGTYIVNVSVDGKMMYRKVVVN